MLCKVRRKTAVKRQQICKRSSDKESYMISFRAECRSDPKLHLGFAILDAISGSLKEVFWNFSRLALGWPGSWLRAEQPGLCFTSSQM